MFNGTENAPHAPAKVITMKTAYKWLPVINRDCCTGCRSCVDACEHGCLEMDVWEFATLRRPEDCGSEGYCTQACPEDVIRMDWVQTNANRDVGQWCDQPEPTASQPKQRSWYLLRFLQRDVSA